MKTQRCCGGFYIKGNLNSINISGLENIQEENEITKRKVISLENSGFKQIVRNKEVIKIVEIDIMREISEISRKLI